MSAPIVYEHKGIFVNVVGVLYAAGPVINAVCLSVKDGIVTSAKSLGENENIG